MNRLKNVKVPISKEDCVILPCSVEGRGFYGEYYEENKALLSPVITERRFGSVLE